MIDISSFALPKDFCHEVRLFPLPEAVTFPISMLPLHIFESRYREMFEDALAGDQLLAMATLEPGYETEYYSRPPVAPTICICRITEHHRNENGTYDFLLLGLQRARIEHEVTPVRSFRRAAVQVLDELLPTNETKAKKLGQQLALKLKGRDETLSKLLDMFAAGEFSLGMLTDIVAQHLKLEVPAKLRLLGETDPLTRARFLLTSLSATTKPENREWPPFSAN